MARAQRMDKCIARVTSIRNKAKRAIVYWNSTDNFRNIVIWQQIFNNTSTLLSSIENMKKYPSSVTTENEIENNTVSV